MKSHKIEEKLDELMSREIEKCGDCEKIRECWALENLSLGKVGHIVHKRPMFNFGFVCHREKYHE